MRLRYDVAHLHLGGNLTIRLILLCLVCSWIPGKKVVLTLHSGGYPSSIKGRTARPTSLQGRVLRRLDGLIGVNQEVVDFFRRLGVPREKTMLIPPYSPTQVIAANLPSGLRDFYDSHKPVIISVGLLEPEYDLSMQIRMLKDLRWSLPRVGLVIIGGGSLEEQLRGEIAQQPNPEHILLCGDLPHPTVLRAIADASILIRTTLFDGDSLAVREALSAGVPVVATDNGMRPSGVQLIAPSDHSALSLAILSRSGERPPNRPAPEPTSVEQNLAAILRFYQELFGTRNVAHQTTGNL